MLNELQPIFEQIDKNLFNEETMKKIATIVESKVNEKVDSRVTLEVESAKQIQEEDYTNKMQHLVKVIKENIDKDHLAKIKFVVENLNTDHMNKLIQLKENYENILKKTALDHKMQLVEGIDAFLEKYIDKNLPKEIIEEAAKNTHVNNLLSEARKVLAVDPSFVKDNIKEAIVDGKKQVDRLIRENAQLRQSKESEEVARFIAEKSSNLPANTAKFVRSRLANKPLKVVKENFDYVVDMFAVQEKKNKNSLVNENKQPISNVDRSKISGDALIIESTEKRQPLSSANPLEDMYMGILNSRN
jgi:hypothetical protein